MSWWHLQHPKKTTGGCATMITQQREADHHKHACFALHSLWSFPSRSGILLHAVVQPCSPASNKNQLGRLPGCVLRFCERGPRRSSAQQSCGLFRRMPFYVVIRRSYQPARQGSRINPVVWLFRKTAARMLLNPAYNPGGGVTLEGIGSMSLSVKQGWDEQRNLVLKEALVHHLLPVLETEVATELRSAARSAVVAEASLGFQRRLDKGRYEREELTAFQKIVKTDSTLKLDQLRVVGIFVTADNREESWAAAIDPSGSVLDHLQLPFQRDMKTKKLKLGLSACEDGVYLLCLVNK